MDPFEELKIEYDFTFEQIIEEIENKKKELDALKFNYDKIIMDSQKRDILPKHNDKFNIKYNMFNNIEDFMNLRYILNLDRDKKYFSEEELIKILNTIEYINNIINSPKNEEVKQPAKEELNEILNGAINIDKENEKELFEILNLLNFTRNVQSRKIFENHKIYENALRKYNANKDNNEYKQNIIDIYIRDKFEEAVIELSKTISAQSSEKIEYNTDFFTELTRNSEYKKIKEAYAQLATREAREKLYSEIYSEIESDSNKKIASPEQTMDTSFDMPFLASKESKTVDLDKQKSANNSNFYNYNESDSKKLHIPEFLIREGRNVNCEFLESNNIDTRELVLFYCNEIDSEFNKILEREKMYEEEWINNRNKSSDEKYDEGIAENCNHDYSWGIILEEPKVIMKNEKIDTPHYKGSMTVEEIGAFTYYYDFKKKKCQREKHENICIKKIKQISKLFFKRERQEEKSMKEYYYKYVYNGVNDSDKIYKITKTDYLGRQSKHIVFSPLQLRKDFANMDYNQREFIKNVYFSKDMISLSNVFYGGYCGQILNENDELTISNKYCKRNVIASKLFQKGIKGKIYDRTHKKSKIYREATKEDLYRLINKSEREREFNE